MMIGMKMKSFHESMKQIGMLGPEDSRAGYNSDEFRVYFGYVRQRRVLKIVSGPSAWVGA